MVFKSGNKDAFKHGMFGTSLYNRWIGMKQRCTNPKYKGYRDYGGRGISYCLEWESFENFARDMGEGFAKNLTLDRIDNDKGYSKENCRWATRKIQQRNRRSNLYLTHKGRTYILAEWAEQLGMKPNTLAQRLCRGWSVERILENKK